MKRNSILVLVLTLVLTLLVGCTKNATTVKKENSATKAAATQAPATQAPVTESKDTKVEGEVTKKVYVTTVGQAEFLNAETLITDEEDGCGLEATCNKELAASDITEGSIVVMVVGFTSKGMGGSITEAGENQRCTAICNLAKEGKIKLVVLHIGGKSRRGTSTDGMLEEACKAAQYVLAETEGDYDGKLTTWVGQGSGTLNKEYDDLYDAIDTLKGYLIELSK